MTRTVWLILVITINAIVATVSPAQTNSYSSATNGFWDEARLWSLATPPSISQSGIFITNAASVNVTIDSITASEFPDTLTISNLTLLAPFGTTNALYLDNTGTTALHVLNDFSIGFNPNSPAGAAVTVISSNSALIVDGLLGGQLEDDGTLVISGGSMITTNCSLQVGVRVFDCCEPTGLLIISNAVVQARDVAIATKDTSRGEIEVFGGTMTLSSTLTINNGGENSVGNMLVANGAQLIVTNGETDIAFGFQGSGTLTVSSASFLATDVFLGGGRGSATLVIDNGSVTLGGQLVIGLGDESNGNVFLNGGMLIVTNDTTTVGSDSGIASMDVSGGNFLGQAVLVQEANLSIQGGISILSSNLQILGFANCFVSSGQLFVTNAPIVVDVLSQCSISGGLLAAQTIELGVLGQGTLTVNGGSVTASAGITLGGCVGISGTGYALVDGGQLIATNTSQSGFIDVRDGQLTLSSGTLQVDKLVMTNSCSSFVHTGGTLLVGNVILDPNAFRIVSATRQSNDVLVSWLMAPGATNALQASNGSYTSNNFTDIFIVTNNTTTGTLTNFLDVGAATNKPSRFYRARLSP